jgi:hypothetical protein
MTFYSDKRGGVSFEFRFINYTTTNECTMVSHMRGGENEWMRLDDENKSYEL